MTTRAERRRFAFGVGVDARTRTGQQYAVRVAAAAMTSFVISMALASIFPAIFTDARAAAAASLSVWGVLSPVLGVWAANSPRSWKAWSAGTLAAGAGWAAASGLSAVFIDQVFIGPHLNVFGAVFVVTFLPMIFLVGLVGIIWRMKRLTERH